MGREGWMGAMALDGLGSPWPGPGPINQRILWNEILPVVRPVTRVMPGRRPERRAGFGA